MNHNQRKTIGWTLEQRALHRAIREAFRDWHPGPEELIASGAAALLGLDVIHFPAQDLLRQLKDLRQVAGLTLADVSSRCGIDQPALCRLETHQKEEKGVSKGRGGRTADSLFQKAERWRRSEIHQRGRLPAKLRHTACACYYGRQPGRKPL